MKWPILQLRHVARFGYGAALPTDELQSGPFSVFGSNGPYGTLGRANTRGPVIVIGRKGSYGKVNWSDDPCFASDTTFYIDASTTPHDLRWLYWLLQTLRLDEGSDEAAVPGLNREDAYARRVPLPSPTAQTTIARFLDSETHKADCLLAAKQRVLDLLSEKRKAIIATAVTRGLDSNVKLRDSGVPWLGEIPAHWEHRNLRFCCTAIQTGGTPAPEFLDYDGDDGLDWLTPGDFGESLVLHRSTRRVAPGALSAGDLKIFPAGTVLVVGIGATLGKVGVLPRPASANQQVNALVPRADVDTSFLAYEMSVLADLLRVSANTATLPILNQQRMGDVPMLVPPLDEQGAIAEHIECETAKLDAVRAATERTIALLKERRSALIAAAVTGQLDVGAAA